jgi:hypothetical protein
MAVVVAVSRELSFQALDGVPQGFWHVGRTQCTTPINAQIYVEEEEKEVENKQRKS